jgi:ssDNA-binding Zn-finger/Zn-ribbon topoisomerase 1
MSADIIDFPDLGRVGCPECGATRTVFKLPVPTAFILAVANTPCPQCGGSGMHIKGLSIAIGGMTTRLAKEA